MGIAQTLRVIQCAKGARRHLGQFLSLDDITEQQGNLGPQQPKTGLHAPMVVLTQPLVDLIGEGQGTFAVALTQVPGQVNGRLQPCVTMLQRQRVFQCGKRFVNLEEFHQGICRRW